MATTLKKINDFLAGLPMTIVAGVFLLLDLVPHLMEEFGGTSVRLSFLPFDCLRQGKSPLLWHWAHCWRTLLPTGQRKG